MKERPILFSAPMVRAILEGRKTQTRRVAKLNAAGRVALAGRNWHPDDPEAVNACPYGQPGDRLWVRETWSEQHPLAVQDGRFSIEGRAGIPGPPGVTYRVIYRADGEPLQIWRNDSNEYPYFTRSGPANEIAAKYPTVCSNFKSGGKAIYWTPSIHMPRRASRITLEVVERRLMLLQHISEEDAISEGVERDRYGWRDYLRKNDLPQRNPGDSFCTLWKSINGPRSWDANPLVWAVKLTRINNG